MKNEKCPWKIDICWLIEKILVYCMTKYVLSMPIKFEVDLLIFSWVMTAAIFENVVSRKMRLKLLLIFFSLIKTFCVWL